MAPVSLTSIELVSLVVETLMYGVFLTLCPQTLYVLFRRPRKSSFVSLSHMNKMVVVVCCSLFCSVSAHWVISVSRAFDAFVRFREMPGGPEVYYLDSKNPKYIIRISLFLFQIVLGDIVIVYRLYLIWAKNKWVILFPCLTITGLLVFGTLDIIGARVAPESFELISFGILCGLFLSTLCTNLYSSLMIGFRVWRSGRNLNRENLDIYPLPFLQIMVESAGLYSLAAIFAFAAFISGSAVDLPALDLTGSSIGTTLCLIVLRAKIFGPTAQGTTSRSMQQVAPGATQVTLSSFSAVCSTNHSATGMSGDCSHSSFFD